jgi:putative oxidoreductase
MPGSPFPSSSDICLLVARLLLALIFVHEGLSLLWTFPDAAVSVAKLGVSPPLLAATVALQIVCGTAIAFGLYERAAAFLLALFCGATAVLFHSRLSVQNELLHFEKDLAIAGGMLAIVAAGGGRLTLSLSRGGEPPRKTPILSKAQEP